MNPPSEQEQSYKFWNRLKEFMTDTNRNNLLAYAGRKTKIAGQYLNISQERELELLGQDVKDRYIRTALENCIRAALSEKWGGVWNKTKQKMEFPNKAKTFYIPEPTDTELLEQVVADYKSIYLIRRKNGLA